MAVITSGAAFVVLVAVTASGIGPARSLQRTIARWGDVVRDVETLQRSVQRLAARAEQVLSTPDGEPD